MAAKLTRLTHKIVIQLHLVAERCTICSSRSRRPVWKLLDTPTYKYITLNRRWIAGWRVENVVQKTFLTLFRSCWILFTKWNRVSSVSKVTRLQAVAGKGQTDSVAHLASYPMGTRGLFSPGIKRPGHEAEHLPPCSAEAKEAWSYTSTPLYVFMVWF
jgi:hypothetical protein